MLVKVPGAVQHNLVLASLEPQWNGSNLFLMLGIANQGNAIEKSKGKVQILSGDKVIFEKEGIMDSIYPQTTGVFSFLAPADLEKSGDYSAKVTWEYADRVAESSLQKLYSFKLSSKDVKSAMVSELATQNKDKQISKNVLILEPKDLAWFAGVIVSVLLLVGMIFFWYIRARRKPKKRWLDSEMEDFNNLQQPIDSSLPPLTLSRTKSRARKKKPFFSDEDINFNDE